MTRAYRPVWVERDAALYALGLDPKHVHWHHEPALEIRPFEMVNGRKVYTPGENDPRHLIPMDPDAHKKRTTEGRSRATVLGSDLHTIDRTRRLSEKQEAMRRRMLAKTTAEDPPAPAKRKHRWGKRPMRREART